MPLPASRVAPLLFGSGLCALVYQVAWLRELRLIFGASTAASAAVLAVFMAGLGAGGMVLGRRADRHPRPLALYASLEIGVAASAAVTPLLVLLARKVYLGLGGAASLGAGGATVARLILAALVLGMPTFVMGGTLPAAARAVSDAADGRRRNLATLYGVNTLGAVAGAWAANFSLIEVFGNRVTLWLACLLNALVGMFARALARAAYERGPSAAPAAEEPAVEEAVEPVLPPSLLWFPAAAAGVAGFAFLLMELVWYRMLGPILGGSSYSFGLILCVALAGIGAGGALYGRLGGGRPATIAAFAWTCGLEAAFIAVPYALGDRVAILAVMLRPLGGVGFYGHVVGWTLVTALVVLPAAIVSGYQFPLVIALFGRGGARVGRHVGLAYAANTAGAIAGSLAGGFGLLPALTAPGCWRLVVLLLAASGLASAALALRTEGSRLRALAPVVAAAAAALLVRATGPTAAWRHSPIGAGRADALLNGISRNGIKDWIAGQKSVIEWQADGVESSVALQSGAAYAFVVNGKIDGNARNDAPTQVMGGLIGAALQPAARRALVIGLGTGSTAGWLAKVPGMERVDVAELEPIVLRVARDAAPVNLDVLDDPRVHVTFGDAREILLTTRERYDLVFSEPSNPYRAGISSLYTREFYQAAARALTPDGIFMQWLQTYDVDGQAVHTALATLSSVFPEVVTFQTEPGDVVFLGTARPIRIPVDVLRARVEGEPFRAAMDAAWRMAGLEAFLARHIAGVGFTRRIAEAEGDRLNVDDDNLLEFAFARQVGKGASLSSSAFLAASRALPADRPEIVAGALDWSKIERRRALIWDDAGAALGPRPSPEERALYEAATRYRAGDLGPAFALWKARRPEPETVYELAMYAEALADARDEDAVPLTEKLRAVRAPEADAILAQLRFRQDKEAEAAMLLGRAFHAYREDPWPLPEVMRRALDLARAIAEHDRRLGDALFEAVATPFSIRNLESARRMTALRVALAVDAPRLCVRALSALEPAPPYNRWLLTQRALCYAKTGHPRAAAAERDLNDFLADSVLPIGAGVVELPEAR